MGAVLKIIIDLAKSGVLSLFFEFIINIIKLIVGIFKKHQDNQQ